MKRDEVIELFKLIKSSYDNFTANKQKADWWHEMLEDVTYGEAVRKLKEHVKGKEDRYNFIPQLADFVSPYDPYEHLKEQKPLTREEMKKQKEKEDAYWAAHDKQWNDNHPFPEDPRMVRGELLWDEWTKYHKKQKSKDKDLTGESQTKQ
jgi:hypothetical protein